MKNEYLTVTSVALMHKVSHRAVLWWIEKEQLPAIRPGNEYLIRRADAEAFKAPPRGKRKKKGGGQ